MKNVFKKLAVLAMVCVMIMSLTACSASSAIGIWTITSMTAEGIEMDDADVQSMGIDSLGSIKFNKSGSCVIELLGDDYDGTWEEDDNGQISITSDGICGTATISDGVMELTADDGIVYTLEK